jgi:hypothetical protein
VFASRLNRGEKALQRGFSELFKSDVLKNFGREAPAQYAFRRLAKPVFLTVASSNTVAIDQPPSQIGAAPPQQSAKPPKQAASAVDDVPLANRITAMEWQRRLQHAVAQVNATLPSDHHVKAHTILPVELFSGDTGRFLMIACDFYGYAFANTLLLPTMPVGAMHFRLPQHPGVTSEEQISDARARVVQLRTRMANEHHRVAAALERGDVDLLFKPNHHRPNYKQELAGICKSIAINALGLSAFVTHESRFSDALGGARV